MTPTSNDQDAINPAHYKDSYPFEVIDMIEHALTPEQFLGYCLGNELKYRLRAGIKTADFEQDMMKAQWYRDRRGKPTAKTQPSQPTDTPPKDPAEVRAEFYDQVFDGEPPQLDRRMWEVIGAMSAEIARLRAEARK